MEKMNKNFWQELKKLKKPFFVLAPMADVTDVVFREIIAKYGKPDVFYTEFVSCDGLMSKGREALLSDLRYTENQRPIVAQVFGSKPENFYESAKLIKELGFDGIDINMGCPDRSIERQCAGASLMKNPKLAQEIIEATKKGAGDMPVSIKTRIGYNENELETWIPALLKAEPAMIAVHGRTRKEMSKVSADWGSIARVVELSSKTNTVILGNGDVKSVKDGLEKARLSGVDGIMIGRSVFGNPWLFGGQTSEITSHRGKLRVLVEHTKLFEKMLGKDKNFAIMKKHYKAYVTGFDGAKELRIKLMESKSFADVEKTISKFLKKDV
jgi:nifR3 family TIM-barrel protein